jgi:hypothetical protein
MSAPGLVFAIHPTSHGFGWALFEGPDALRDWSTASARGKSSAKYMRRFKELIDTYRPATLVLETYGGEASRRSENMQTLAETMRGFAAARGMDTPLYSRTDVGTAIINQPDATRHAVACAVAKRFPFLKPKLPSERNLWDAEPEQLCLFNAVALGLAHYALTKKAA